MKNGNLLIAMLLFQAEALIILVEDEIVKLECSIAVASVVSTTACSLRSRAAGWSVHVAVLRGRFIQTFTPVVSQVSLSVFLSP